MVRAHLQRPEGRPLRTLEVLAFEYEAGGALLAHETTGSVVAAAAPGERAELLAESPAGRLFLCADRRAIYFATDWEPRRPLLLVDEPSPLDAALHSRTGVVAAGAAKPALPGDRNLTGFVV